MGCHFLLQEIFPTQGSNPCLLHCRQILYRLSYKGSSCNAGNTGDVGPILGSGRSPGGGNGNPFQYPCLENPMDRRAWWATVRGVTENCTQLSTHSGTCIKCLIESSTALKDGDETGARLVLVRCQKRKQLSVWTQRTSDWHL